MGKGLFGLQCIIWRCHFTVCPPQKLASGPEALRGSWVGYLTEKLELCSVSPAALHLTALACSVTQKDCIKTVNTAATLAAPRCQTCLILSRQPHRVCEQLRRLKTGSVNSSHYQIIFAQQHVLNGHRTSTNNKLNLSIKVFNIIWLLSRIHML